MSTTERASVTWRRLLDELYGAEVGAVAASSIASVLATHSSAADARPGWDERDAWLITYPDQFRRAGEAPLATLRDFYAAHLSDALNGVHVLPFFPWSSDDGYSIVDYDAVDPSYGTWSDIEGLASEASLMIDAVINHLSAQGEWFRRYLADDPEYRDFFRTSDPTADLSLVTRAREHPLLTEFATSNGSRHVWTTFSADQVDLDFRNPAVLSRVVDVVLSYAAHGARAIRLDAIGFLWKDESTTSIHLRETHLIVQLIRTCLDIAYPGTMVITETNVPQTENYSYFGDGSHPEAHVVYQFALPPLVLHTLLSGDATQLATWAASASLDVPGTTFLNFLASHDGVGLRPVEDMLTAEELGSLLVAATTRGGRVGYRSLADGTPSPYELNATWFDLLATGDEDSSIARHLASHSIMLALRGIPALYVHSLFGSPNDLAALDVGGQRRSINRTKFSDVAALESALAERRTRAARCLEGLGQMLRWRRSSPAFHPDAAQRVLDLPPGIFGVRREHDSGAAATVLVNVAGSEAVVGADDTRGDLHGFGVTSDAGALRLAPWATAWIIDR